MPLEHAPAKINLGLHVLRKRPDGYHDVETILHKIDWFDTVTAEPAEDLSMTCSDPSLPTDESNLCMQAARRLAEACGVTSGAALHLEKRIPYGAGLGGGSSDAAATLRLCSRLWNVDPSPTQLQEIARSIGADVPFFLTDEPAAYATGRGDELTPVYDGDAPYRLSFPLLVFVPPVTISTPVAYDAVTPNDTDRPNLPALLRANDLAQWKTALENDFESPVTDRYEPVAETRAWLEKQGAAYVSLSGSGSAVYGLFHTMEGADQARAEGRSRDGRVHVMDPSDPVPAPAL